MHFIDILVFVPKSIRSVNKYQVLVFVVNHLGDVVQVDVLQESQDGDHVESMSRSCHDSLHTVLDVHVVMVVTISNILQVPSTSILELKRNLPHVTYISQPLQ